VTFYSGFDGPAERSIMELDMPGPRKGLLRLAGGKPFTCADAPPVPPDATSWSMNQLRHGSLLRHRPASRREHRPPDPPDDVGKVKDFVKLADASLGISLRDDLLTALGDKVVSYTARPARGR